MNELFSDCSFSHGRAVVCLVLSAILLISLVPAPVLAQEGTSIPGSGTGAGQGNETSGTTVQNNSSNSSDGCGGTIGCAISAGNNVKNGFISLGESAYDGVNPFNPDGFGQELNNATSEFASAGDNAKSAVKQIPGPWEVLMDLFGKAVSGFINFVLNIASGILWALFSLPAPGSAFDVGTWFTGNAPPLSGNNTSIVSNTSAMANSSANATNVTAIQPMREGGGTDRSIPPAGIDFNAWWDVVWGVYAGIGGLASLVLFVTGVFALSGGSATPRERNQRIRDLAIAAALVLFGPIIMPAILHFGNIITAGLVPDAVELLNSPGDILKIGEAVGLFLLGSYIASTVMGIGLLIATVVSFAQWIMTFLIAATWPVWAALYGSQNATLKAWSRVGFASFGILVGLKMFQGLLFRIAWLLPLSFNEPADSVLTLLAFPLLLYVIFYRLPKYAVQKTVPAFVTTVGGGGNSYTYDNSTQRNFFHDFSDDTNNPGDGGGGGSGGGGGAGAGAGGGGGGGPPPDDGGTTDPKRPRTRDNDSDSGVDSGTNNPDDSGNVDSGSDTNNPDDSGDVDSSSNTDNPESQSETDTSNGTNNPSVGGSEDVAANGSRGSGQDTGSAGTGNSTGRQSEGSSSTGAKGSTEAPTDKELREALDQAGAEGDGTVESGADNTEDPGDREVPPDIQQHITRMEQEAPESSSSEDNGGRPRTRDNSSDGSEVTEVVEEVKERPSTNNSGINEGSDMSSSVGEEGGGSSSGSSSGGSSGSGGGGSGGGGS